MILPFLVAGHVEDKTLRRLIVDRFGFDLDIFL
jgi:hypothetical protein